ncbi:MAG: hypothetical protein ACLFR7_08125, partial [Opitutales bacterium]
MSTPHRAGGEGTGSSPLVWGCFTAALVVCALLLAGGFWLWSNGRGLLADFALAAADEVFVEARMDPAEKAEVRSELRALATAFEEGALSYAELGRIAQTLSESPLLQAVQLTALQQHYVERADLTAEEVVAARETLGGLTRAVMGGRLGEHRFEEILAPISGREEGGLELLGRSEVSGEELRVMLARAREALAETGVAPGPAEVDWSAELRRLI